jgi:RNA polymerase sigma factor (sigma-70 family)
MGHDGESVRIEDLLAHAEWLARLVRGLVADPQGADDIVQETWLAALRRPPRRMASVRAWLATVARNAIRARGRSEAGRRRREERVSRTDLLPDTASLVERAEWRRRLAGLVLGLPEPYRSTILLRFGEGLKPGEIARRSGTPASTVRGRLQTALALLRDELDRDSEGDRKAWMAAVLPLAGLEAVRATMTGGAAVAGGWIMGTKVKLALTAAIVLALATVATLTHPWVRPPADADPERFARAPVPAEPSMAADVTPVDDREIPSWAFTGRVIGPGRHAAPGVTVELWRDGKIHSFVVSDEDGRFRLPPGPLPAGRKPQFVLSAQDASGLRALRTAYFSVPRDEDVALRPLILVEGYPLAVNVVDADGLGIARAGVALFGGGQIRQGIVVSATTDDTGRASFPSLPPEQFRVAAWADGHASATRMAGVPWMATEALRIRLLRPRAVDIEVVEMPDERPVPGVVLRVVRDGTDRSTGHAYHPPLDIPPTDANGRTRIVGIGRDPSLRLGLVARGYATLNWSPSLQRWNAWPSRFPAIPPDEDRMRIVLPPARSVSWPVVAGEIPIPPDDVRIICHLARGRIPKAPRPTYPLGVDFGRMENGFLVVRGLIDQPYAAIAETPEGALARLSINSEETEGQPVSFSRPRTLEVFLRHEDGTAVVGRGVSIPDLRGAGRGYTKTNASGVARIKGLLAGEGNILVSSPGGVLRRADLTTGDARVELVVPMASLNDRGIPIRIHVTLSGVRGLPSKYRFDFPWDGSGIRVDEERPEEGLILGTWTPGPGKNRGKIALHSPLHIPVETRVDLSTRDITFDLQPAGQLLLRVLRTPGTWVSGALERRDGSDWVQASGSESSRRAIEPPLNGVAWFRRGLPPGRYRCRDVRSDLVSDEVIVTAGGPPVTLTLDARSLRRISGVVRGPAGADLAAAHVELIRTDRGAPGDEVRVDAKGYFRTLLRGVTGEVRLRVRHPLLRGHPERGQATIPGAAHNVKLELVPGAVARMIINVESGVRPPRSVRVLLFRHDGSREIAARLPATVDIQGPGLWRLRFSGYEAGTWDVWCEPSREHAPILLEGVEFTTAAVDLGEVRLERGSTLSGAFELPAEGGPFFVRLRAETLDGPPFQRNELGVDAKELVLLGLGAGRYRVRGSIFGPDESVVGRGLDEVVILDGRSAYTRVIRSGR